MSSARTKNQTTSSAGIETGLGATLASWRWPLLAAFVGTFAYFLIYFRAAVWQPSVDAAWLLASVCWALAFWRRDTPSLGFLRQPYWFYLLYFVILLPFGPDWRWVMAGDNLSWPYGGIAVVEYGPSQSLLSANGADNFGYLQTNLHNTFMLLVEPTIFWHRVGKIAVGVLALAAVYTFFARLVQPTFGLLVAACAASCSVWIVYTYASVPFIDGLASGYALLAIGLWIQRDPQSRRAWLTLGLLSGFMAFLTPNGWFLALCVWAWLTAQVFWRRWPVAHLALAVATTLIVAAPMLIQWSQGGGGQLFSLVQNPGWTQQKVIEFLRQAAFIPFESDIQGAGAFGPQLPWGFRWLFIPGILLTPFFPRLFPGARFVLGVYVVQVLILAFAQGPYVAVSVKRALTLIPMATYFAFLPFHRWLRSLWVVLPIIAVWASFGVYDVVYRMQPGRTGYTFLDGVVEAHQRFSDAQTVCVYVSRGDYPEQFEPGSKMDRLYGLSPRIRHVTDPVDPLCRQVLCFCPQLDEVDLPALGYTEVKMLGTVELRCGRSDGAAGAALGFPARTLTSMRAVSPGG